MRTTPLVLVLALAACNTFPAPNQLGETGSSDTAGSDSSDSDSSGSDSTSSDSSGDTSGGVDPILAAEDFGCILDWPKVRRFRVTNVLGEVDATLAVANAAEGGVYPVGSLIQLVPTEAMVKRAPGFAPQAHDWEFFSLSVSAAGTEILDRGSDQVVNAFGGNCFDCHAKAQPQWDFICEQDHGCDPLPITAEQIDALQNADPRCP